MEINDLLAQGAQLAVLGMGTVFIILSVLILGITLMTRLAPPDEHASHASETLLSSTPHPGASVPSAHRQAIAQALQRHRAKFRG